jgi:hypothetical protein
MVQECDFKGVVGGKSARRTPVSRPAGTVESSDFLQKGRQIIGFAT